MNVTFVSNYINHHQIPFCNAMSRLCMGEGGSFVFIQTQPMERERVRMGWQEGERPEYVRLYYEEEELCKRLILECDAVLFGGCDEEDYIRERLALCRQGKPLLRISERLYKTGQWKAVSPRGLRKKYKDHTSHRGEPVYLLCAGAYVPSDFHLVGAYPGKMFCWGYFPETRQYDIEKLLTEKGYGQEGRPKRLPYLLWAGRMIDWKHPELALETAAYLKEKGYAFHMDIIGGGELEGRMRELLHRKGLESRVSLLGYRTPAQVREHMERADIYLFTSDRQEGWGAVANEAMNSGCALVADHMIGAAPYLVRPGQNGLLYEDGNSRMLFRQTEELLLDEGMRKRLGRSAYRTIAEVWNAENGAKRLTELIRALLEGELPELLYKEKPDLKRACPCMPAPVISERKMFREVQR